VVSSADNLVTGAKVMNSLDLPYVSAFLNSRLLRFLYVDSQRNDPPKFQLWKPTTFKATALESCDSRKIDLYRDYMEKKPTGT